LGRTWRVIFDTRPIILDGEEVDGVSSSEEQLITISFTPTMAREQQRQHLLHEVIHSWHQTAGSHPEDEEGCVRQTEVALYQFGRDQHNKWAMDFIFREEISSED